MIKMIYLCLFIAFFYFIAAVYRSYYNLFHAFDTGLYLQWAINFFNYYDLASSIAGEKNFLAHHFQPLFLIFSPIVSYFSSPIILSLISLGSLLVTIFCIIPKVNNSSQGAALCILILTPTIHGRIWFNFCPDILALPIWLTMSLKDHNKQQPSLWFWSFSFLLTGLCKEYFWIINSIFSVYLSIINDKKRCFFIAAAAVQALVAIILLCYWMPHHSNYQQYAPLLNYGKIALNWNNFLWVIILLSCFGLWHYKLWHPLQLVGLPSLIMIIFSEDPRLSSPLNHYFIPSIIFLWVGVFKKLHKSPHILSPQLMTLPMIALSVMLFIETISNTATSINTHRLKKDTSQLTKYMHIHDPLVVDGMLQPLLPQFTNTRILLGFRGNPRQWQQTDLTNHFYVLTTLNFMKIPSCYQFLHTKTNMKWNRSGFLMLCNTIKKQGIKVASTDMTYLFYVHSQDSFAASSW